MQISEKCLCKNKIYVDDALKINYFVGKKIIVLFGVMLKLILVLKKVKIQSQENSGRYILSAKVIFCK